MRYWMPVWAALPWLLGSPVAAAEGDLTIRGTLTVAPELAANIGEGDRLVIKSYHPQGGVEMDAKYQIVKRFELPLEFVVAPSILMSGETKFDAYVVEMFTDKDNDVLAVAPGELLARTDEPVPLGTTGLALELNTPRE